MSALSTPLPKRRGLSCRNAIITAGILSIPLAGALAQAIPASATSALGLTGAAAAPSAAAPEAPVAVAAPVAPASDEAFVQAFYDAGYSYVDAEALAWYWNVPDADPYTAKVKAGAYLAQGIRLAKSPLADGTLDDGLSTNDLVDLFFGYGYTGEDAATLASQWGLTERKAKIRAGRELKTVGAIPFVDPAYLDDVPAVDAFFNAGYSYEDAVALAQNWGLADAYTAKVKAGGYLKAGTPLNATPYANPTFDDGLSKAQLGEFFFISGYTAEDAQILADAWNVTVKAAKARAGSELKVVGVLPFVDLAGVSDSYAPKIDAFFGAGCTYDDAVILADLWGLGGDTYAAKVKAGSFLLASEPLPVTTPPLGC